MTMPEVGDAVTTQRARELCLELGEPFAYIVERIEANPAAFRSWNFDGASGLPDRLASRVLRIPHLIEIALKHDLKYAYGEPSNAGERMAADREFKRDLLADGCRAVIAELMFRAVRMFGTEHLPTSFRWGFARVR